MNIYIQPCMYEARFALHLSLSLTSDARSLPAKSMNESLPALAPFLLKLILSTASERCECIYSV